MLHSRGIKSANNSEYKVLANNSEFTVVQTNFPCGPHIFTESTNMHESRHEKPCLREFPTRSDSNRSAQLQKLARVLKFRS